MLILHYSGPNEFSRAVVATGTPNRLGQTSVDVPIAGPINSTVRYELQWIEFADSVGNTVYFRGNPSSQTGVKGSVSRAFYSTSLLPSTHDVNLSVADFGPTGERFGGTGRAINLSTRGFVGSGEQVMIVGIVVSSGTKTFLFRGVGPALGAFGVTGFLQAPRLELKNQAGQVIHSNEKWDAALANTMAGVGAFAFQFGSSDSAIRATLGPGNYTLAVGSTDGGTGVALAEAYELP